MTTRDSGLISDPDITLAEVQADEERSDPFHYTPLSCVTSLAMYRL